MSRSRIASRRNNAHRHTLVLGALAAALAAPALAQGALTLEEVIVTAQKRPESLQDTPISVAAFGQRELESIGVYETGQVSEYIANLTIDRQPASLDNYGYSIRGIGSGETSLLVENTVGVYLDGIYIARNTGATFDIVELERMEVLRGPQGTLYGRNTIGGAINIITEKPREAFALRQHLGFGSRDFIRTRTTIDTGLLGDMLAAKLSYNHNEKDGLVTNSIHGNRLGEQESDAWRIALRLTPAEGITADYSYDKSERENNGATSQIVATRPPNNLIGGAITRQATEFATPKRRGGLPMQFSPGADTFSDIEMHALTLAWEASDSLTLKYIVSRREWDSGTTGTDFGAFPADGATVLEDPTVAPGALVPAGEHRSVFRAERQSDNEQTTHELQALGDALEERLQYALGLYRFEEQSNEDNPQWFILPASFAYATRPQAIQQFLCRGSCIGKDVQLSAPTFQYGSDNESLAVFGQFTYALDEALDLTAGIRYTEDDKSAYLRQGRIVNAAGEVLDNRAGDNWDNTSGTLTLSYAVNDDVNVYATLANGYRSGGFGARSTSAADFRQGYDEETVTNYEVGIKSDWLARRLRVNGALFHMEYEDNQVASFQAGEGGASSVVLNAGELEIQGVELELTALLSEGLRLMLNYGYTDAEYTEFLTRRLDPVTAQPAPGPAADPATGNEDISDVARLGRAPEHNGSLILSYDFQPFRVGRANLRVEASYRDEMVFHPQLSLHDSTEEQTLLHARASLSEIDALGGSLGVALWGRNLTDEEYREWGIDFGTLGFATDSFKERRSIGVDLLFEFGRD